MPTLPSGLTVAIHKGHLIETDENWFHAPENHFWYWTPTEDNPPPFNSDDEWEAHPESGPAPRTMDEAKKYIRVVAELDNGNYYWRGDFLSDFPNYHQISDDDLKAWQAWTESEQVTTFIKNFIFECHELAERAWVNILVNSFSMLMALRFACISCHQYDWLEKIKIDAEQ